MATGQALAGEGIALDRWAQAWELLTRLPGEAEALNLDRADAFFTAMRAHNRAAFDAQRAYCDALLGG